MNKICYQCEKDVKHLFEDSRCKDCTRMTPDEVKGMEDVSADMSTPSQEMENVN